MILGIYYRVQKDSGLESLTVRRNSLLITGNTTKIQNLEGTKNPVTLANTVTITIIKALVSILKYEIYV